MMSAQVFDLLFGPPCLHFLLIFSIELNATSLTPGNPLLTADVIYKYDPQGVCGPPPLHRDHLQQHAQEGQAQPGAEVLSARGK